MDRPQSGFDADTRAMSPPKVVFSLVVLVGLVSTATSGFLVVRGPFFGGELLDPIPLFGALIAFVAGIVLLTWGGTRLFDIGARV